MLNTFFLTLLLAHAIADYPLQTNTVYGFKIRSFWGIVLHVLIFTLTALVAIVAVGWQVNPSILTFLGLLTVLHIIEDKLKLAVYKGNVFFWYVADQIIHVLCLALAYLVPLTLTAEPWYAGGSIHFTLLAGTGIIYASYASSIGLHFWEKAFRDPHSIYRRQWGEVIEMALWAFLFFAFPKWMLILLVAGLGLKWVIRKQVALKMFARVASIVIPFVVAAGVCGIMSS